MKIPFLVLLCAAGVACGDSTSDEVNNENDISVEDVLEDVGSEPGYEYLVLSDLMASDTCEGMSPGADIDAARLYSDPTQSKIIATLAECEWLNQGKSCDQNNYSDPVAAQGDKDGGPVSGFVSLNGGDIICKWSGNAQLTHGMLISVYETGSGIKLEEFAIRACMDKSANECGNNIKIKKDQQTVPAGALLP